MSTRVPHMRPQVDVCARINLLPADTVVQLRSPHHVSVVAPGGPPKLFPLPPAQPPAQPSARPARAVAPARPSVCRRALSLVTLDPALTRRFLRVAIALS